MSIAEESPSALDDEEEEEENEAEEEFFADDVPEDDQFGRLKYLEKCQELRVNPVSQIMKYLEGEELLVAHYGLGLKGAICLIEALKVNSNLTTVRIADNNVPDMALAILFQELADKKPLTNLDISGNKIGINGCKALAEALNTKGNSIRVLSLARLHLTDKEGSVLMQCLESNTQLKVLDLSHNSLGERTGMALGAMLAVNYGLVDLDLSWNQLRSRGVVAMCEGLRTNVSLQALDLAWVGMGDSGATALGGVMRASQGLVDVNLMGNSITQEGAKALASGIATNSSLAAVVLDNNDLRDEGAKALLEAIEKNKGLVACRMDNCNTSVTVRLAIDALLIPRVAEAAQQGIAGGEATSILSRAISRTQHKPDLYNIIRESPSVGA